MREMEFFECLKKRYPANEYALIPQVRNRTGYSTRTRTADAVALSLWPSRGIDLTGFEFKDSRGDWLKELADSSKSEEIGRYCAYWWLVVSDAKICPDDEIPGNWGLLRVKDESVVCVKKAPRRAFEPPTWEFVAAVMRAAAGAVTGEDEVKRKIAAAVAKSDEGRYQAIRDAEAKALANMTGEGPRAIKAMREFESASGVKIEDWDGKRIGEAVKFVIDGGLGQFVDRLRRAGRLVSGFQRTTADVLHEIAPEDSCVI